MVHSDSILEVEILGHFGVLEILGIIFIWKIAGVDTVISGSPSAYFPNNP